MDDGRKHISGSIRRMSEMMKEKFKIYTDYYGRRFTMNNEVEPEAFAMQVSEVEYA